MSTGEGNSSRDWRLGEHYVHALLSGFSPDFHLAEDLLPEIRAAISKAETIAESGVCSLVDALTIAVEFLSDRAMELNTVPTRRTIVVLAHLLAVQSNGPLISVSSLRQRFQKLSTDQQLALQFRYVDCLSTAKIAERVQLGPAKAAALLAQTRQQLLANLIPQERATGGRPGRLEGEIPFRGTASDALRCSRYFDGLMSESELLQFDQHVCTDISFARELAWQCRLHALLRRTLASTAPDAVAAKAIDTESESAGSLSSPDLLPVVSSGTRRPIIVVIPVLLLLLLFWWILFSDGPLNVQDYRAELPDGASPRSAVLSVGRLYFLKENGNRWQDTGDLIIGERVIQLRRGTGLIRLRNGIRIALTGPASFVMESDHHFHLVDGTAVADSSGTAGVLLLTTGRVRAVMSKGTIGGRSDYGLSTAVQSFVTPLSVHVLKVASGGSYVSRELSAETSLHLEGDDVSGQLESGIRPEFSALWKLAVGIERLPEEFRIASGSVPGSRNTQGADLRVIPEGIIMAPSAGILVNLASPGRLQIDDSANDHPRIDAGVRLRSFRVSLGSSPGDTSVNRVTGEIRFNEPVLGIIGQTSLLNKTDLILRRPLEEQYVWRGIEVGSGKGSERSVRDLVTLSNDRRSIYFSFNASVAVDEIRILVQYRP